MPDQLLNIEITVARRDHVIVQTVWSTASNRLDMSKLRRTDIEEFKDATQLKARLDLLTDALFEHW